MQELMAKASAIVLGSFELRSDVKIMPSSERYLDPGGTVRSCYRPSTLSHQHSAPRPTAPSTTLQATQATYAKDSLRNNRGVSLRRGREAFIVTHMVFDAAQFPHDIASLKAMLIEENRRAVEAEARASDLDAEIENLKLQIAKLRHARFGNSSERASVPMDQLELQLGEL